MRLLGRTPFLHVFPDNPAIALYKRLGFVARTRMRAIWNMPIVA